MWVSLFTDASVYDQHEAGGWGAWVKSERGRRYGGGAIKVDIKSSNEAEMMAIAKGLALGIKTGIIEKGDSVLIQSDNKCAIKNLESGDENHPKDKHKVVAIVNKIVKEHDLFLKYRHVKGHMGNGQKRYAVNEICDRLAKDGAKEAIRIKQQSKALSHITGANLQPERKLTRKEEKRGVLSYFKSFAKK